MNKMHELNTQILAAYIDLMERTTRRERAATELF
jgi:hypothetical protein